MKISRGYLEILFILVLLLLITTTVYANAGTGFFFPGILHVLIGNVIIGLIEAFFVRTVFKIAASYGIIVLANYASSILGYIISLVVLSDLDLLSISVLPTALTLWFIASVLIEWPFFAWAVKEPFSFSKSSFKYTFYAQCVSYALLIPYHFLTFDQGRLPASAYVIYDLENLAADARMFGARGTIYGGGGGSYEGFTLPKKYPSDNGHFSAISSRDSIVFVVMDVESTRTIASVVLDSTGSLHSWIYKFEPSEASSKERITYLLNRLAEIAYDYRIRPFLLRGGKETYSDYSIPKRLSVNENGYYAASIVSRDSIVFVAMDTGRTKTIARAVLDSAGKLHSWEFSVEPQGFPELDPISDAFGLLADSAQKYRGRPTSETGGGGSFDGFSIPKDLWILKYRSYTAAVSRDSIVFTATVKDSARVIASVVLDSTGRLHSWKWMGEIR